MENKILLFIPMYNCEKQIIRLLKQITPEIESFVSSVIIVNNRSTDKSENVAINYIRNSTNSIEIKLLRNKHNYGLGGSHKVAFEYAVKHGFDYVIVLHGDDQGRIADFLPLLQTKKYEKYDCCLGARFMKGAKLYGYSWVRVWGNYVFNFLFSIVVGQPIYDLGSGLNLYKVETLKNKYYQKYPDTLYFNDCMILAACFYGQRMLFYPISWREEDQISNNKIIKFAIALLKMLGKYILNKERYLKSDMRCKVIDNYEVEFVFQKHSGNMSRSF